MYGGKKEKEIFDGKEKERDFIALYISLLKVWSADKVYLYQEKSEKRGYYDTFYNDRAHFLIKELHSSSLKLELL